MGMDITNRLIVGVRMPESAIFEMRLVGRCGHPATTGPYCPMCGQRWGTKNERVGLTALGVSLGIDFKAHAEGQSPHAPSASVGAWYVGRGPEVVVGKMLGKGDPIEDVDPVAVDAGDVMLASRSLPGLGVVRVFCLPSVSS